MKNFRLFFGSLLCGFLVFLICRFIFDYFLSLKLSTSISLFICLLAIIFAVKLFNVKDKKQCIVKETIREKENVLLHLTFLSKTEQKNLFFKAFTIKNLKPVKQKKYLLLTERKILVLIKFGTEKISKADIVSVYNFGGFEKAFILCDDFDNEILNFSRRFTPKIILKDGDYAYSLLKETNCLPEIKFLPPDNANRSKFCELKYKKNAKKFFLFGVGFILFSFFSTLKTYYLLVGFAFVCFSFALALFGKTEKNDKDQIY